MIVRHLALSATFHTRLRARSFTLVELIVAMAISSVIILAVTAAFGMGLRLWHRVEDRRPFEEQARHIIAMFRSELTGIYIPSVEEEAPLPFEHVQIQETGEWKLSFFTTTPSYYRGLPPGRCARVTYEYRNANPGDDSGGVLVRREQLAAGGKLIAEPMSEAVAEDFSSFLLQCEYDESGGGDDSVDDDANPLRVPRRVLLEITWEVNGHSGARADVVSFTVHIMVPVEDGLVPKT